MNVLIWLHKSCNLIEEGIDVSHIEHIDLNQQNTSGKFDRKSQ